MGYGGDDCTVVSAAWDKEIKIHMDEKDDFTSIEGGDHESKKRHSSQLRGRQNAHQKDIICGDIAMHLDLIVTGSRDNRVKIWDYERI